MIGRAFLSGFTLIEVLVSLSILALALGAGLRATAVATDNGAELKERAIARWVGRNQLARLQLQPTLPGTGSISGEVHQGPYDFVWKADVDATPNPGIRRAVVSVQRPNSSNFLYQIQGYVAVRE